MLTFFADLVRLRSSRADLLTSLPELGSILYPSLSDLRTVVGLPLRITLFVIILSSNSDFFFLEFELKLDH